MLPRLKASIIYEYDFGDSWMHSIVVEDIVESAIEGQVPSCIAGADACPPEDCGDPPGYANLVEALTEPDLSRQPVPGPRPGLSCQAPAAMRTYFLGFSENSCSSSAGMSGGNRWAAIDRDPLWHHNGVF